MSILHVGGLCVVDGWQEARSQPCRNNGDPVLVELEATAVLRLAGAMTHGKTKFRRSEASL